MIELKDSALVFSFPEVHAEASLQIDFQRTLRIPDDDREYPLPPGLGRFPLRHVDDFGRSLPAKWLEHGGVMLPMYQAEALWVNFYSWRQSYPFAVRIATGKINAVTGESWAEGLNRDPQDYLVVPGQPWLDGYCLKKGIIRQFVAMALGEGYSAEEQLTGAAEHGGLQIIAYPMKREVYQRRFAHLRRLKQFARFELHYAAPAMAAKAEMGLAPGGRMRQEVYEDPYDLADWDLRHRSRCFVHIANSLTWHAITGEQSPTKPPTAQDYSKAGLPWFDYYGGDLKALEGAVKLKDLKSVAEVSQQKGQPLPDNEAVEPGRVIMLRGSRKGDQVREGTF